MEITENISRDLAAKKYFGFGNWNEKLPDH
jgi:hypothetical protein